MFAALLLLFAFMMVASVIGVADTLRLLIAYGLFRIANIIILFVEAEKKKEGT